MWLAGRTERADVANRRATIRGVPRSRAKCWRQLLLGSRDDGTTFGREEVLALDPQGGDGRVARDVFPAGAGRPEPRSRRVGASIRLRGSRRREKTPDHGLIRCC